MVVSVRVDGKVRGICLDGVRIQSRIVAEFGVFSLSVGGI